jgi:hypothetical protein
MSDETSEPRLWRQLSSRLVRDWLPRAGASVSVGLLILAVGALIHSQVYPDDNKGEASVAAAVVYMAVLVGVLATWFYLDDGGALADESRQRVREAERDLEEALRAGRSPVGVRDDDEADAPPIAGEPGGLSPVPRAVGLALPELWAVTHSRLDHYHETALRQAQRSFRNAQVAMALGFVLLVLFVVVALYASTTAGAVVAGGLGAVSAALAGYVSRTFVRSQEASASHLRAYFDQPLEFARFLAAERIVMDGGLTQEQRAEVLSALVQAMVSGPSLPGGPGQ